MAQRRFSSAVEEVTRLAGPPPVLPCVLRGGTRLTGRWDNGVYDGYVGPMNEHVIAATFVGAGLVTADIDGHRYHVPSLTGTFTLAPRGHEGHWRITEHINVSNIYLGHERLAGCADELAEGRAFTLLDRVNAHDPKLFAIARLIADEVDRPEHHSMVFMEHAVDLLCFHLLRAHSSLADLLFQPQHGLPRWQVRRVIDYIRANLGTGMSLQDLADVVGMSRFHFCSAFRAATGSPPHAYVTRVRMKKACELLADPRLPIRDVAMAVGYATPSAFSAVFRRVVGMTPREYRGRN